MAGHSGGRARGPGTSAGEGQERNTGSPGSPAEGPGTPLIHLAATVACLTLEVRHESESVIPGCLRHVRFSNRPVGVKRFQTVHGVGGIDVARGLMLLFGIGTSALPS